MPPAAIDGAVPAVRAAGRAIPGVIPVPHPRYHQSFAWQWPHLFSIDAPVVALVWQRWWAHVAGVTLPFSREVILGLGVWLIYLADRLADASDHQSGGIESARHAFSSRRRSVLLPLAGSVALALTVLAPARLPPEEFAPGLGVLTLAGGYFWLIHGRPDRRWAAYLPKEALVGGMFGAGATFFVLCRSPRLPLACLAGGFLFAGLCFLNCALITRWERQTQDVRDPSSLLNAFPRFSACLRAVCLLFAVGAFAISAATRSSFALPVAVSALLLAGLDRLKLPVNVARILADVALWTPLFWLCV